MGSTMKPTIFNDRVAAALKNWHRTARKETKHGKSGSTTPLTSRPATPTYGMSPVHLLHNFRQMDSSHTSPRTSNFDNNNQWDAEGSPSHHHDGIIDHSIHNRQMINQGEQHLVIHQGEQELVQVQTLAPGTTSTSTSTQLPMAPRPIRTQHEINMNASEFSFEKRG